MGFWSNWMWKYDFVYFFGDNFLTTALGRVVFSLAKKNFFKGGFKCAWQSL